MVRAVGIAKAAQIAGVGPAPEPYDCNEIIRALRIFHQQGDVVELRIPNAGKVRTISGYFDDFKRMAKRVRNLSVNKEANGIYFTVNKINPALLHRCVNGTREYAKQTTSDNDVIKLNWLPVDLDPIRPAGISSSDEEHEAALDKAREIRSGLMERGWPEGAFVFGDSGNGAHLSIKIDLEPTGENVELVKRCLMILDFIFSDEVVKVDTTTSNPSRIWKLAGTMARKGDGSQERPHRMARILETPSEKYENLESVSRELLEGLAAILPKDEQMRYDRRGGDDFDPVRWAEDHGLEISKVKSWNSGVLVELEECPFNSDHHRTARIVRLASGARYFGCFHDGCSGKNWRALQEKLGIKAPGTLSCTKSIDSDRGVAVSGSTGTATHTVEEAIIALAAKCDGATSKDDSGYNEFDAEDFGGWAKKIQSGESLPSDTAFSARNRLHKYRKQLADLGISWDSIRLPVSGTEHAFEMEELCDEKVDKNGNVVGYKFSRSRTADAIQDKIHLAIGPDGKKIHFFDGEIYPASGEPRIKDIIYSVAGNEVRKHDVAEILDRIRSRLMMHPVEFNPDPYLMPLLNGVVDLQTREFRAYMAEDLITFKYNAIWDPEGGDWKRVLWHMCSTLKDPRDVLIALDILTATVIRIPFGAWCLLFGSGSNGKGKYELLLLNFIWQDRTSAMRLEEVKQSRFGIGGLLGKDLLIVSEVESVKDAHSLLKLAATGEYIDGDIKFATTRAKGRLHLMIILDANCAFDYGDDSFGRKRRTIRLDFPYTFGDGPDMRPIDRTLDDQFKSPEVLSGLAWLIAARAPSLIAARKIFSYKTINESEEEFERQRNSLYYFTEECLSDSAAPGEDKLTTAKAHEFYIEYCEFFNVFSPASQKQLTSYIKKKFETDIKKSSTIVDGKKVDFRYFEFIGLAKTPAEAYADYKKRYSTAEAVDTTADVRQKKFEKIDVESYITALTADTAHSVIESVREIVEEINNMYHFIYTCENNNEIKSITYRSYLDFHAVDAVSAVRDRSLSFSPSINSRIPCRKDDENRRKADDFDETDTDLCSQRSSQYADNQTITGKLEETAKRESEQATKSTKNKHNAKPDDGLKSRGEIIEEAKSIAEGLMAQGLSVTFENIKGYLEEKLGKAAPSEAVERVMSVLRAAGWSTDTNGAMSPPTEGVA